MIERVTPNQVEEGNLLLEKKVLDPSQNLCTAIFALVLRLGFSYGLVRLSLFLSLPLAPGSSLLWTANGLQIAAIISCYPRIRLFVPLGFFVAVLLGLLSIYTPKTSALLSLIHCLESIIISGSILAVSKGSSPLKKIESLAVLLGSTLLVVTIAAVCRSLILIYDLETTLNLSNAILLDWGATFAGDLIVAPLFMFPPSTTALDLGNLSTLVPIITGSLCIGVAFGLQYLLPNKASMLILFIQFPLLYMSAYVGGYVGLSMTSLAAILGNIGFSFISSFSTIPLSISLSSGPILVLFFHSAIQIGCLCLVEGTHHRRQFSATPVASKETAHTVGISRNPTLKTEEMMSDEIYLVNKSRYLSLMFSQIHSPLIAIIEACQNAKQKLEIDSSKLISPIVNQTALVLSSVDDYLSYERLESGSVKPKLVSANLKDVIDLPIACAQKVFDKHNVLFEIRSNLVSEWVFVDPIFLQQAILNLLLGTLDLLSDTPEKVVLDIKYNFSSPKNPGELSEVSTLEILLSIPTAKIDFDTESIFIAFLQKLDKPAASQICSLTLPVAKTLINMLGGELRSYLTSSKGWKIAFELTFQTSSISKNSVAEASAADQIGPYLKTLGMMAKTKRKEKECHASLSMTSVASDIENPPTLFGFLASSLTGYMKTEVFKKSSTRSLMTKQMYLGDEAKSHPSRKSNASALSSGLSSLRRSISSSKNFRKKQVHYLDSTNNMGSSDSKDFEVIDKKLILQGDALMSSSDGDVEQLSLRSSGISLRVPSMKGSSIIAGSNKSSRQGTMRRKTSLHQETNYARADYGSADNAIGEKPENRPMLFEEYRVSQNAGLLHISLPASRRNSSIQSHRASLSSMRRDSVTKEGKSNTISQQDNDAKALESSYPVAIPEVESRNMSIKSESVDDIDLDSEILEAATESVMRVYQHNSCISDHLQGNILLVDDSSVFRQILNKFLTTISSEFSISEAANGEEAFVKCQSTLFNLIFLDMDMPKLNGGQLATKLSSHNYSSPIVIITSNTIPKDEVTRLSTMSVTEVISKPLSKDKVLQLLIKYNKPIALKGIELFSPTVNIPEVQVTDSAASIRTTRSATLPIQISRSPSEARSTAEGTLDGRFNSLKSESSSSRSQNEGPIPIETKLHRFQTGSQESEVGRLSVPSMHTDIKATIPPSSSSAALVVDDSIINRSILVKMLEKLELFDEIVQVANGHDAIRFCTMKPFKIIFMDLEMPGMHGEEAAARIRATGSKTPIIAVTGNIVRGKDENNLKVVGISQILLKPVDRATVKEICSKYGLQGGHRDLTPVSPTNLSAPKPGFGSLRRNLQ